MPLFWSHGRLRAEVTGSRLKSQFRFNFTLFLTVLQTPSLFILSLCGRTSVSTTNSPQFLQRLGRLPLQSQTDLISHKEAPTFSCICMPHGLQGLQFPLVSAGGSKLIPPGQPQCINSTKIHGIILTYDFTFQDAHTLLAGIFKHQFLVFRSRRKPQNPGALDYLSSRRVRLII